MSSNDKVLALKRKALTCKREGDIEGAKTYLRQAKQLEQEQSDAAVLRKSDEASAAPEEHNETTDSNRSYDDGHIEDTEEEEQADDKPRYEDPVNRAMDEANLDELEQKDGVQFTDNELIDHEAMQNVREIMSDHFPTEAFYQERIMANKRAALAEKQANNIPVAKQRIMTAKQLEKACTILFQKPQADKDDKDDDTEDYSLLDELVGDGTTHTQNDDGFFEQLFGKAATVLELDDLDGMDAALLKDMMEAGMQVPSVEEVLQSAEERKIAAVALKKDGNLEAAKAALLESKRLIIKANQLSSLLQVIENGLSQEFDPEVELGNMLKAGDEKKRPQKSQEGAIVTNKLLSSAEYREQAVQHKQRGNKDAAIAALRLYKEAVALEEQAKAAAQKKEWILELQKEAVLASEQARKFVYYSQFVDERAGSKMASAWRLYGEKCTSHAMALDAGLESASFSLQRRTEEGGLQTISDSDFNFVGTSCNPGECRIEISILELIDLQNNKRLREQVALVTDTDPGEQQLVLPDADSIRVVMSIHLPKNAEVADDSEQALTFTANSLLDDNKTYVFGQPQYIHAERGTSRFAKLFVRRLARRRCVVVEVFFSHKIVTKGLFSNSSTTEEISLGSAGLELTALQEKNFIAMDLPLLEARREVGGSVRLGIRSGSPFCETSNTSSVAAREVSAETTGLGQQLVMMESYPQLAFPQ